LNKFGLLNNRDGEKKREQRLNKCGLLSNRDGEKKREQSNPEAYKVSTKRRETFYSEYRNHDEPG